MELQEIPRQEMKAIFGEMRARMHLNIMVCQNTKFLGTFLLGGRKSFKSSLQKALQ
jgi:hypothetical protein